MFLEFPDKIFQFIIFVFEVGGSAILLCDNIVFFPDLNEQLFKLLFDLSLVAIAGHPTSEMSYDLFICLRRSISDSRMLILF